MKSNTFAVMKKELARFFGDKRMVLATVIVPGLLIYIMYSFMGNAITNKFETDVGFVPDAQVVNLPQSVADILADVALTQTVVQEDKIEGIKKNIAAKSGELLVVFPEDFDKKVSEYDPQSNEAAPNVEIYFNGLDKNSAAAYETFNGVLEQYENSIANKFDINNGEQSFNLASEKDSAGTVFSSMLPMLILIFLFSGCMSVAPEAIAGEKERGTIATLLVTPSKRSELATGKIIALAIIALLSGASSTLGTLLSMPKLMGAAGDVSAAVYTASDYLMLSGVILSTVLVLVTLISIISAFAKTVKEAQTLVMPLMVIVMFVGVTGLFSEGTASGLVWYLIPVYNTVQCLTGIFSFTASASYVLVSIGANLAFTVIGTLVLTKMFDSEKIMFKR